MIIEHLSHTADEAIKVEGFGLDDLFRNALKGMNNILKKGFCDTVKRFDCQMQIEVESTSKTCLLIDFLSEILTLSYVQKAIFCGVYFSHFSKNKLVATVYGTWFDQFEEEIKAITYHEAHIRRTEKGLWETCIIFDV
ncbi:archease [Poritiphilus flavus]|uniref:Archease domain-containing protein n=1 Tax=Poritiphilus flavus TaxID=2697053 RepID=A0A6L9EC50_9FLAO|nr:archease [Poritiphilus flavus]NAS12267.1 hypothetical protein [Poritiphilus flavus]